ncbi:Inositol hexakisphosphate and diphosphoinositol-pentakisphosphate kinase [Forsythia ovata]|uniref:Inositol hexakisphosphate and diphosphoinositol-pentakisphosphate kinase n=1 Tax=Forsythia ovata TaxID=205694 RepID=A0ABD1X5J3_9LAMI
MEVMHPEDEALVGRQTTPRQDDNTISDTDHESSREMKGYNNGNEVEKNASTTEHGQAEGRYHSSTVSGMEIFKRANTVRLKSRHNKYLTADSNEESVIQDRFGSSKSVYWTVEFVEGVESVLRLKSCYGKYLTASDETFLLGMTGQKVVQTMP